MPSGDATGQNFVNAAAVQIDDFETPTVAVKTFADLRQMLGKAYLLPYLHAELGLIGRPG